MTSNDENGIYSVRSGLRGKHYEKALISFRISIHRTKEQNATRYRRFELFFMNCKGWTLNMYINVFVFESGCHRDSGVKCNDRMVYSFCVDEYYSEVMKYR